MGRRDRIVPSPTIMRIPLLSNKQGVNVPFGFGPVSIVCNSFIVEMS